MEFSVRVVGPDDDHAVTSLYRWLVQDADVRRHATVSLPPAPRRPGDMGGGTIELIDVLLGNGIGLAGLVLAVVSWRRSRPRPPMTYIEHGDLRISVEDASPETIRALLAALDDPAEQPPASRHRASEARPPETDDGSGPG